MFSDADTAPIAPKPEKDAQKDDAYYGYSGKWVPKYLNSKGKGKRPRSKGKYGKPNQGKYGKSKGKPRGKAEIRVFSDYQGRFNVVRATPERTQFADTPAFTDYLLFALFSRNLKVLIEDHKFVAPAGRDKCRTR